MKTKALALGLAISFVSSAALLAADKDQKSKDDITPAPAKAKLSKTEKQEAKSVAVTGSYIKRDVKKHGRIIDGSDTLYVLDNDTIRQTGAADLSQVLIRRGFRR